MSWWGGKLEMCGCWSCIDRSFELDGRFMMRNGSVEGECWEEESWCGLCSLRGVRWSVFVLRINWGVNDC